MKKINNLIIIILSVFILDFCGTTSTHNNRIKIYDYGIGDSLTNEFEIIKVQDFPFSRAKYKKDNRFKVNLINNYITELTFSKLTPNEHIIRVKHHLM